MELGWVLGILSVKIVSPGMDLVPRCLHTAYFLPLLK